MEPVRKNGNAQIVWVSKDVASETSNGHEMVQVYWSVDNLFTFCGSLYYLFTYIKVHDA
jgi:hypothetical protein